MYNKLGKIMRKFTLFTLLLVIGQVTLIFLSDLLFYRKEVVSIINTSIIDVYNNYTGDGWLFLKMTIAVLNAIYEYEKLFIHSSLMVWIIVVSIIILIALKNKITNLLSKKKSN